MKSRMLLSTAAIALLTIGTAMAQTENRRPDDTSRPQAQTPSTQSTPTTPSTQSGQSGSSSQPQARPERQRQQGAQAPQGSQSQPTTGQAPQQPQSGQAQSEQPSGRQQRSRTQGTQQGGQSAPSTAQGTQRDQGTTTQSGQPQRQGTQRTQSGQPSQQGTSTQQSTAPSRQGGAGQADSVQLDDQQRSRISTTISQQNVRPLSNVNFSVSVGTVVPRTVRVQTVPASIVSIVPQYRGYSYFVVEDRIVIVQPRTKKIVTVIDKSGGPGGARAASGRKFDLTTEQRASIRRHATSGQRATTTGSSGGATSITVGERVPETIELQSFPSTVYEEVPMVRDYRYFMRDSDVIVVDPGEHRVIEIIR